MRVIVVDDEKLILQTETAMIRKLMPDAEVEAFSCMEDVMDYAGRNPIDIAFLDINLEVRSGIELAKKLQEINPELNVIFCTGYSEYSLEALELYCSAYLLKPITEDKLKKALSNLRHPVRNRADGLCVRCFGNFEALCGGEPIRFKYAKTKEMLAYLIDRCGALLSNRDIMTVLFEKDDKESYMRNIKADLVATFRTLEIEDSLRQEWGKIGIKVENIHCDYYDYLNGRKDAFHGEYMTQYSFAEATLARLLQREDSG